MDYAQKLEIMAAAITAETAMNMDVNLEKGVLDGLRRIEEREKKEKEALDPLVSFCVEHIQEGYGIWNSGGYDEKKRYGTSTVAAGPEGERLRLVHYEKKVNGNHSLAVIYPGCYIAQSVAFDYFESSDTIVYQVVSISQRNGSYQADCRKVLRINPRMSRLSKKKEEHLMRLVRISNQIAIAPNLIRIKEGWV